MRVYVFLAFLLVIQAVHQLDAASVSLSSNYMDLNGKSRVRFYEPRERVWSGLSRGHRFPIITSGDRIALRMDWYTGHTYSKYWMGCTTSYCSASTCPGDVVMKSNKWSSCRRQTFFIRAIGKTDGQPINSGDMVYLSSGYYSRTYRLRCYSSTSTKCRLTGVSDSNYKGNNWFNYGYTLFQMFSRNSVDGNPVQYGDTVAFRYPYYYGHMWLKWSSYWYARSCSYSNKYSCASQNSYTGLQIFKPL